MTTTITVLERVMTSEVENLHLRIDDELLPRLNAIEKRLDAVEMRLDTIDRHIQLLWNSVHELQQDVAEIRHMMVTKDELRAVVTEIVTETVKDVVATTVRELVVPLLKARL